MLFVSLRRAAALAFLLSPAVACAQPGDQAPQQNAGQAAPQQNASPAAGNGPFKTFEEKLSYAIGLNTGRTMQQQGLNPDAQIFMKGFQDSFKETDPLLTDEEIQEVFTQVQAQLREKAEMAQQKLVESWNTTFAEDKAPQGGWQNTKSGLKYQVFEKGEGAKPKASDVVVVHYSGKLPDGKVFDSSLQRGEPAVFQLDQVIKGWTEGLQLMSKGAKYKFDIPAELAYGKEGRPPRIPPNQNLIFEVELVDVMAQDAAAPPE